MVNLSDIVGELDVKMEGIKKGVDAMRGEVQTIERNVAIMLEQVAYLRTKWEDQEWERKNKAKERDRPSEFTQNSEVSPGIGMGREFEDGIGGNWWPEVQGRRLEMPSFEGENLDEWIFRAKRYFTINQLSEEEKIELAALCFEAGALAWFQWETQ